ncbi:Ger(x)C family spore germination protein [Paenibacillus hamazuiensis]|uniref:Ger(x)C family spore germination protein n=1 Tax=Paenibacillus hamazuiensis TaxID=2936508 RepID=UPI00200D18EA|nr:Ger(x)C family spore germination protein [Paenibacillus hamazuiensis]
MIKRIWTSICVLAICLLTGCWDRAELPQKGFVMGVAADEAEGGKIALTTQVFRPSQGIGPAGSKAAENAYVNVQTIDDTVPRAIRDIPINLGRKAQWSHTRLIIVSEKLARDRGINNLIEFFMRDHEPRLTISFMIVEGRADAYLRTKPLIENTISQQLVQSEETAASFSSKTINSNLLKLGLQMKSEVGNATVPYLYLTREPSPTVTNTAGIALLKKGKLAGLMPPSKVEILQMLLNEYESGMIDIPCGAETESGGIKEAVEVVSARSSWRPVIGEDSVIVSGKLKMDVAITELSCSRVEKVEEEQQFAKKVEETVERRIAETIDWLKNKKFDALGLGDKVYKKNPALWKQWKEGWDDRFASSEFHFDVKVRVINSGTTTGNPVLKK